MSQTLDKVTSEAIALLHELCTQHGILASTIDTENYKRIWARDSIVCGLAGLWLDDKIIINALKQSLLTLAQHQHAQGMIPSNVNPHTHDVSYGSLVGRIDTNTWFTVGSCLYYQHTKDYQTWDILKPSVEKCRSFLKTAEFNGKGWIYTPLSGNWADEYPVHGYTLYDNVLRLWGEQLWKELQEVPMPKLANILQKTRENFWPSETTKATVIYQTKPFEATLQKLPKHYLAFILPGNYDTRFDAAGNALAIIHLGLKEEQKDKLANFIKTLPHQLVPAFWPVINEHSKDWNLLNGNYSYAFKNHPGDFHNGGVWPVWMGLFCYALSKRGMQRDAQNIITAFLKQLPTSEPWEFQEYFNPITENWRGKTQMGYSASGVVFMKLAMEKL